jgi:hypothetical protein
VLAVLGSRTGVVSVYGDVHNGSILKNIRHRIHECSFGPIGRYGGRSVIPGFGPMMKDFDGRALEMIALYHAKYQSPRFEPIAGPRYWNFLDMTFDPRGREPTIGLTIRNMVDAPDTPPRGGGHVATTAAQTGRAPISRLPEIRTLPDADVQLATTDGTPIRGLRSLADGTLPPTGLSDVAPNSPIIVTAHKAEVVEAKMVTTLPFR